MVNVVTIAAYNRICWLRLIGLVQRLAATWRCMLHSPDEPGELWQWQCHVDSTMNIGIIIIMLLFVVVVVVVNVAGMYLWSVGVSDASVNHIL